MIESIDIPVHVDVTWEPPEELIDKIADRVAEKLRPYITTPAPPRQDPYPWQMPSPPWTPYHDLISWN